MTEWGRLTAVSFVGIESNVGFGFGYSGPCGKCGPKPRNFFDACVCVGPFLRQNHSQIPVVAWTYHLSIPSLHNPLLIIPPFSFPVSSHTRCSRCLTATRKRMPFKASWFGHPPTPIPRWTCFVNTSTLDFHSASPTTTTCGDGLATTSTSFGRVFGSIPM